MKIALAQINSVIGGFETNRQKIIGFAAEAASQNVDLVLFPELAVCGYPPMDLLDQNAFTEQNIRSVRILQQSLPPDIAVGIGFVNRTPYSHGKSLVNEYGIIHNCRLVFEQIKTLLPTYDVFDEARNFEPAQDWNVFVFAGERIGIAVCEDVWRETDIPGTSYRIDPVRMLLDKGATLLCVPSASPFVAGKHEVRLELARRIAARGNVPIVYVNAVGANDSIIFDGRSFVLSPGQTVPDTCSTSVAFDEELLVWSR
ncbi:MAG: hypothetical protein LBT89_02635 [Planctomycetaceae bacterium]|jgi:NAD+ synthase (glutamine-hydrolysing)|nr:hypothetical protein [Planctomycetaceae bacterium]